MEFPHEFADNNLKTNALDRNSEEFQRLEWLGDRVINLAVAKLLFDNYPEQNEESLSLAIGKYINNSNLAKVAKQFAEIQSTESTKKTADYLEALIGAVYLDANFNTAFTCVEKLFSEMIKNPLGDIWTKDVKTKVNEISQNEYGCLAKYTEIEIEEGYQATCKVGKITATGIGKNKNLAKMDAAKKILTKLNQDN